MACASHNKHIKPAKEMLTAKFIFVTKNSFSSPNWLLPIVSLLQAAELRQASISSNSQHCDGNQGKCSPFTGSNCPAGFASPCTLGITPVTGSGPTAHGCTSAFSSLGTSGSSLLRNTWVTSACAAQHFSTPICWEQLQTTFILRHCLLFRGKTDVFCLRIFTQPRTSSLKMAIF